MYSRIPALNGDVYRYNFTSEDYPVVPEGHRLLGRHLHHHHHQQPERSCSLAPRWIVIQKVYLRAKRRIKALAPMVMLVQRDEESHSLAQVHPNLLQDLLNNLVTLLFDTDIHSIIDGVVHHLLSLLHDVILALELHGDSLKGRKVHRAVHTPQCHGRALHGLHHLLVGAVRLWAVS